MLEVCLLEVFKKLPKKVKKDAYFKKLKSIVLNDVFNGNVNILCSIGVCKEIYGELAQYEYLYPLNDEAMVYFLYELDGNIVEFGVKKEVDGYSVQLNKMNGSRRTKTILVKHKGNSLIETVDSGVINGYCNKFDMEIYCYNLDYTDTIDIDIEAFKDELFSKQFGVPLNMVRNIRNNFDKFFVQVSEMEAAIYMMNKDVELSEKDLFYFREPFYLIDMKEYMKLEYAKYRVEDGKKIYDVERINELACIDRIDWILDYLLQYIGGDSEVVISNNLFKNLVLVLSGYMANAINTKGVIIKKCDVGFVLYWVHIVKDKVLIDEKEISEAEAKEIFEKNPLNAEVAGLSNFFEVRNL